MFVKLEERIDTPFKDLKKIVKGEYPIHQFEFDFLTMPKSGELVHGKRREGITKRLFTELEKICTPCLYWFECESEEIATKAKKEIYNFKINKLTHGRTTPATNKTENSKNLYVGIRQGGNQKKNGATNISDRMWQHLGYYSKGSTQGLQLVYWCNYKIKLTVIELPDKAKPFLNIIEKLFALNLKPVVGKH
jgi:hypothetical protein